ncbi:MAG TPA: DUF4386 domain-containing protein [Bacteroidia bacterium]
MNQNSTIVKTARTAGLLYFLQIPLGVFGIIYIPTQIMISDDMAQSLINIQSNEWMFRLSVFSSIVCSLVTVLTAVYIKRVLAPVDASIAKWILNFTLVALPITLLNELNHIAILLISDLGTNSSWTAGQIHSALSFFNQLHKYGLHLTDIFFGLWLLPMGWLIIRSTYMPKIIGCFLLLTCLGYLTDVCTFYLFPDFKIVFSEFAWLGEVMMVLWLLIKGVRVNAYERFINLK